MKRGFTIIEVVLVLAIAGLIFLMLFIAVPAAQRAQRDRLRKQDVGVIVGAVQQYKKNNSGKPPPETDQSSSGSLDPEDPRYDVDGDGIADNWQTSAHSEALDPYLAGLSDGWVTRNVGVVHAPKKSAGNWLRLSIGDSDITGDVTIIVGARCPKEDKGVYIEMELTGITGDIAVFRYLEAGYFYCENVSN